MMKYIVIALVAMVLSTMSVVGSIGVVDTNGQSDYVVAFSTDAMREGMPEKIANAEDRYMADEDLGINARAIAVGTEVTILEYALPAFKGYFAVQVPDEMMTRYISKKLVSVMQEGALENGAAPQAGEVSYRAPVTKIYIDTTEQLSSYQQSIRGEHSATMKGVIHSVSKTGSGVYGYYDTYANRAADYSDLEMEKMIKDKNVVMIPNHTEVVIFTQYNVPGMVAVRSAETSPTVYFVFEECIQVTEL